MASQPCWFAYSAEISDQVACFVTIGQLSFAYSPHGLLGVTRCRSCWEVGEGIRGGELLAQIQLGGLRGPWAAPLVLVLVGLLDSAKQQN